MSKVRIELNHEGIRSLLRSDKMQNILEKEAKKISAKSKGATEVYVADTRAVAEVTGDDGNNSLLRAMR